MNKIMKHICLFGASDSQCFMHLASVCACFNTVLFFHNSLNFMFLFCLFICTLCFTAVFKMCDVNKVELSVRFQLQMAGDQSQTGVELTGTTRGGRRNQELVNLGSLTAEERKPLMVPPLKRYTTSFCFIL